MFHPKKEAEDVRNKQEAYLLALLNGFRGKRSEMEAADHLTFAGSADDIQEERPKKYNRARVLLGKRNF